VVTVVYAHTASCLHLRGREHDDQRESEVGKRAEIEKEESDSRQQMSNLHIPIIRSMWRFEDEDVRPQLLLSILGSMELPEYSCDIFTTFMTSSEDGGLLFTSYRTLTPHVH